MQTEIRLDPKKISDSQVTREALFEKWLQNEVSILWGLFSWGYTNTNDLYFKFTKIARLLKVRQSLYKQNDLRIFNRFFINEWYKKLRPTRFTQTSESDPVLSRLQLLSWDERIQILALFVAKWDVDKVAFCFQRSASSIIFNVFRTLKKLMGFESTYLMGSQDSDCYRMAFRMPEYLLNIEWQDDLRHFDKTKFEKHIQVCVSCKHLFGNAVKIRNELEALKISKLSDADLSNIQNHEVPYRYKNRILRSVSETPIWFKVPLQLVLSFVIVLLVVSTPYVGEFYPPIQNLFNQSTYQIRSLQWPEWQFSENINRVKQVANEWSWDLSQTINTGRKQISQELSEVFSKQQNQEESPTLLNKNEVIETADLQNSSSVPQENVAQQVVQPPPPVIPQDIVTKSNVNQVTKSTSEISVQFYRWGALLKNMDLEAPQILNVLSQYGVRMAGELPLGAQYKGGRYFHFYVKKEFLTKVEVELGEKINLMKFTKSKAKSERQEPPGEIRIVFWVGQE